MTKINIHDYLWKKSKEVRGLDYGDDYEAEESAKGIRMCYGDSHTKEGTRNLLDLIYLVFDEGYYVATMELWKNHLSHSLGYDGNPPHGKKLTKEVLDVKFWIYLPAQIVHYGKCREIHNYNAGLYSHTIRDNRTQMRIWVCRADYLNIYLPGGEEWWKKVNIDMEKVNRLLENGMPVMFAKAWKIVEPYCKKVGDYDHGLDPNRVPKPVPLEEN